MGSLSLWHWLIVMGVVLLFFGRGKIPELMGDFAKGIRNFKRSMAEDDSAAVLKAVEQKSDGTHTNR